jgi:hypothetical protein
MIADIVIFRIYASTDTPSGNFKVDIVLLFLQGRNISISGCPLSKTIRQPRSSKILLRIIISWVLRQNSHPKYNHDSYGHCNPHPLRKKENGLRFCQLLQ